jgi:TP901 family phage tail tape measure protein
MAISQAEVPAMRLGARTRELMTTLGNTIKWQLASTAIHGVSGAINEATSYIKKFDEALTEIRMVSKLNDIELLSFVEDTRQIAKEVNATALEIAQGSAIFFQQGLPVEEVEARMAITAKMAHVTGTSVENVSS